MEILQITIEVAEGQTETLVVHEDDSPEYLAAQFCLKYRQTDFIQQLLTQQFRDKIEQVRRHRHISPPSLVVMKYADSTNDDDGEVDFEPEDDERPPAMIN